MDETANLGLAYIMPSQAQKYVTHNEALRDLDSIVQLAVLDRDLASPPGSPAAGDRYLVASGATAGWSGHSGAIAAYQDGLWLFYPPQIGWRVWIEDEAVLVAWTGTIWKPVGIGVNPVPMVGVVATADSTNRLAVKSDAILFSNDDVTPGTGDMLVSLTKASVGKTAGIAFEDNGSTRALAGLLGDDNFAIKTSPDGTSFHQAISLDNATGHVGVGTTADGTNALSVGGATALLANASGDFRLTLSKSAAADTASLVLQDAYSGRAEIGLAGDDNLHFKVSTDGTTWVDNVRIGQTYLDLGGDSLKNVFDFNGAPPGHWGNSLINGNFDLAEYATSSTASGYAVFNRWRDECNGSTQTVSQQAHSVGQTLVPGNPQRFSRSVIVSSAGAGNYARKTQRIEGVGSHQGQQITVTAYVEADTTRNIALSIVQSFGTGGSPSSAVTTPVSLKSVTTSFGRVDWVLTVPSITGKTLGTNGDDYLEIRLWWDAGSSFATEASALGQQSGTFDVSRISVRRGDRSKEDDPFAGRPVALEKMLAARYLPATYGGNVNFETIGGGTSRSTTVAHFILPLRATARATPSLRYSALSDLRLLLASGSSAGAPTAVAIDAAGLSTVGVAVTIGSAVLVAGQSTEFIVGPTLSARVFLECEL